MAATRRGGEHDERRRRPDPARASGTAAACSSAVHSLARSVLELSTRAAEPARRDVVVVRVDGEQVLLIGAGGAACVAAEALRVAAVRDRDVPAGGGPPERPAEHGAQRPDPGCVTALAEHRDGVLLADLLAAGITSVLGPPALAGRLLARLAADALSGRWLMPDELLLVGFGPDVPRAGRVRALESPSQAAEHLARRRASVALVAVAPRAAGAGRGLDRLTDLAGASEGRRTALLLPVAHPAARLLVLSSPSPLDAPLALVLPARSAPAGRSRSRPGTLVAGDPVGAGGDPAGVGGDPAGVGGDPAGAPPPALGSDAPLGQRRGQRALAMRLFGPRRSDELARDAPDPVEVAVLGPVEVRGAERSFERRPTLTELVAYLALHPEGASTAIWSTAVWPDRRVPVQTVANRLSEARRCLGLASDGMPRLRRCADRHVLVDVTTDWERFRRLAGANELASRRRALALVRGRPFVNLRSGSWTVLDGLDGEIVSTVTACARDLAEELLAVGDSDGASWAARRGLRVAPWDERLHRLLMRAAHAAGDRAGIDAVLRQLALLLETDGDPLRVVHPATAALYADLTTPARLALGSRSRA